MFTALGNVTTPAVVPIIESWSINLCFTATTTTLKMGQPVKLNTDGTVQAQVLGTELAIGVVSVGGPATYDNPNKVTVQTIFSALVSGIADAAVAVNDKLYSSGLDGSGIIKWKKCPTGATNYAIAIALSAGADTVAINVGILRSPLLVV